jgi:hypothetical protein
MEVFRFLFILANAQEGLFFGRRHIVILLGSLSRLEVECSHSLDHLTLRLLTSKQDGLARLLAQLVGDQSWTVFTANVTTSNVDQGPPSESEYGQADFGLAAGSGPAGTPSAGFSDQLDNLSPLSGAGQIIVYS